MGKKHLAFGAACSPTLDTIARVAAALGVDTADLVCSSRP